MSVQPSATPTAGPAAARVEVPDWGNQTSVFQTRQPAFWLLAFLLVVTGVIWLGRELELLQAAPTAWLLSIGLLALYAIPVFAAVYFLDLFEREPLSLVAAALIWGGVVSIALAGPTNTAWLQILQKTMGPQFAAEWGPALVGPAVEETLKFIGIITIWLIARSEIDDIFDGFVYGAMIGLGFTVVEDVHYFIRFAAQGGSEIGPVLYGYFIRVIAGGLYTHVLFTGIAGMGFAYYLTRLDQPRDRRLMFAIGGFALAVFAHFFWNSPMLGFLLGNDPGPINWLLYATVKGLPFFVFLVLMARLAHRRETRWFEAAVSQHIGGDALTPEDVKTLSDIRSRRRARKEMGRRKGPEGERLAGRLQSAQLSLAMMATRTGTTVDDVDRQVDIISGIRADIAKLPDVSAAVVPAAAVPAAAVPPAPAPPAWAPTHLAPPDGLQSWDQPDASRPMTLLAAGLPLVVVQRVGDWAQVRAVNGWTGWVDGRRLVATT
ncbi:MAG: PrsW family intramembrane metalloprotease [Chloroflexi bacterium]|nr:PrsW family intramembrane metalloprotease [Chloroflexota bacterium]